MEEICNCLHIPAPENNVSQFLVVFCVSEFGHYPVVLGVEVAETNFQKEKKKILSICGAGIVLAHHRTPCVCNLCQVVGTVSPVDQVL